MSPSPADELHGLRARAYGRDADIHEDAEALRRLDELENGPAAGAEHADLDGAEHADTAEQADAEDARTEAAPDPDAPREGEEPARPARSSRRRLVGLLWASSLVLVAVIAGFGGAAMTEATRIAPFDVEATQVGVLKPDPNAEVPGILGGAEGGAVMFAEFHGMRTATVSNGWGGSTSPCLQVMSSADLATATDDSFSGMMYGACGAGAFPAAVQFLVTPELPEELRAVFPEGSALQFVLQDDRVVVFSSEEFETAPPP